jgi:hypothetical protein
MQLLERRHDAVSELPREAAGPGGGASDAVREAGASLFRATDDAIDRSLSGDSLAFLHHTRQEGGE